MTAKANLAKGESVAAVEQFLQLLARAVHQFRVYPSGSAFRVDAVSAAQRSLASIDGPDCLDARVSQRELVVNEAGMGAGTVVERELVRPMRRASVGRLRIQYDSTQQDLTQFCSALIQIQGSEDSDLADLLIERGVERIEAEATSRPEIVEINEDAGTISETVGRERARRAGLSDQSAAVHHLYPPDSGWIRVDPSSPLSTISLPELAILIEDPSQLAAILLRLSGEDPADADGAGSALERKFSDLGTVFASLEPNLARVMFARLARGVLELEPESRTRLLKRTVLPGLLDGRVDGSILQDFPDVELADALCLLLELETAAPEVLAVALTRLDLTADRRDTVLPLLNGRLRKGDVSAHPAAGSQPNKALDGYAQRLIQVDSDQTKSFAEFSAFDVSIDDLTLACVEAIRDAAATTDVVEQQIQCLCNLVRLEPSAERVEAFLSLIMPLVAALDGQAQRETVMAWLVKLREISTSVEVRRPQVAERVSAAIQSFCTRERAVWLTEMYQTGVAGRSLVTGYVDALAPGIAPVFAALLDDERMHASLPTLVNLVCDHAAALAPGLVKQLGHVSPAATRAIVRALGCAGAGYEAAVASRLAHGDATLGREALKALVRIGTPHAAGIVAAHILDADDTLRSAAAEALWRFPSRSVTAQLRLILRREDFVVQHPELVLQFLKRAHLAGGFEPELRHLAALRQRFWRPALMRVASTARQLLSS